VREWLRIVTASGLALVLLLGPAREVGAQEVVVGGGWIPFSFDTVDLFVAEGPFTFVSAQPVVVTVTDVSCFADVFRLYDSGTVVGQTSAVPSIVSCRDGTTDPDVALASPRYSHGVFRLGAGSHALDIQTVQSPIGGGGAFLRVDVASPQLLPTKTACQQGRIVRLCR
jgi:hypothetical protein